MLVRLKQVRFHSFSFRHILCSVAALLQTYILIFQPPVIKVRSTDNVKSLRPPWEPELTLDREKNAANEIFKKPAGERESKLRGGKRERKVRLSGKG